MWSVEACAAGTSLCSSADGRLERTAQIHNPMRRPIVIIGIAIFLALALSAGLSCSNLRKDYFQSFEEKTAVDRLPMSDTEPGLSHPCRTTISFRDGQFIQQESDFFLTGPYDCKFGMVVAYPSSGGGIAGMYNPFSHTLLWSGQLYRNTPRP